MDSRSDESDVVGVVSEFDDDTYLCFVCRERGKECESSTCVVYKNYIHECVICEKNVSQGRN